MLPPDLAFLAKAIRNNPPIGTFPLDSSCKVPATQELADRIIAWGRQKHEGRSIIENVRIYNNYTIEDLEGQDIVNISVFVNTPGIGPKTLNLNKAYVGHWQCRHCNRFVWTQVDDLKVKIRKELDIQMVDLDEWIASARVRPLLEKYGVVFRPLKNEPNHFQIVVTDTVPVNLHVLPTRAEDPCPACGRWQRVRRAKTLEGSLGVTSPDIIVAIMPAPALKPLDKDIPAWAIGDELIGCFDPEERVWPHTAGEAVGYMPQLTQFTFGTSFFARADLYRELLEFGVTTTIFEPVSIVAA